MRWCERNFSMENSVAWLNYVEAAWSRGEAYNFAIVFDDPGLLAGSIWLSKLDRKHGTANLGYWVRTSQAGKGIATAAGRLIASFGFAELGLNRLEIVVAQGNRASERVAEKLGASREGLLRERLQVEGVVKDAFIFGLLCRDFHNKKG
jgi:RimJ/RimL family protein N-acetyltransferase